jgi:hypothetical protein
LLFRTSSHKNNPEGRSILRNAYRPWFYMKRIEEIEAIGVERDLAGLPVVWVDPIYFGDNATDAQKAALEAWKEVAINLRRDEQEGLVMPSLYTDSGQPMFKVELLSAGGARQFDTNGIITRYSQRIAMTVMADWLLLGQSNVGSWALSSDKTNLFAVALGAWIEMIESVFNDYAIPRLFAMNGMDTTELPTIKASDIENPDLAVIGAFLSALVGAGATLFPNNELLKYLFKIAGLPEPSEEQLDQIHQAAMQAQADPAGEAGTTTGTTPTEDAQIDEVLQGMQ